MKCIKCGYEAIMLEFTRSGINCCSGSHLRQCPKCNELSHCNPIMEEIWEEKFQQTQGNNAGDIPEKEIKTYR
ncbi:MAG: hypothetical protein WA118_12860 [Carboxydocellales bacterium]